MSKTRSARTKRASHYGESRLPLAGPLEAFYLGGLVDARETLTRLAVLIDADAPESTLHRHLRREIELLDARCNAQWNAFLAVSSTVAMERSALAAMGPPDAVRVDEAEGIPVAIWEQEDPADAPVWAATVAATVAAAGVSFVPTTPFREVRVASLPAGTALVRLTDPRHAATAALDDVLHAAMTDVALHVRGTSPSVAWRRLAYLVAFYNKAAKITAKTLGDDEFRDWDPQAPQSVRVEHMARTVAAGGATSRAQQLLALQMVGKLIGRTMIECERDDMGGEEASWVQATIERLESAHEVIGEAMRGYNIALMAFAGRETHTASAMTVMRPLPRGLPVLAVIPDEEAAPVTRLDV